MAEELSANGYDRKRCPSSDFKAKYEEMEEYSISATGDMDMELVWNWPRLSVAAFATELKLRRKKYRSKGNRSVSFGSNSYYQESNEADRSRRRYLKVCILLQAPVIPSVTMFGQELEIGYAGLYPASQDVCDLKL